VQFDKKLEKYGINVTIRREMGADIDGACGQLRQNYISEIISHQENLNEYEARYHEGFFCD
jgi:23S rRNA (adenine2503-C2)-methyltransferase